MTMSEYHAFAKRNRKRRQRPDGKVVWYNPSRSGKGKKKAPQHLTPQKEPLLPLVKKMPQLTVFSLLFGAALFVILFTAKAMADAPKATALAAGQYQTLTVPMKVEAATLTAEFTVAVAERSSETETQTPQQGDGVIMYPNSPLTEREELIVAFLCLSRENGGAGLTKAGAAAVLGCAYHESGLNPNALNPNDGGYGLLQWTDVGESMRKQMLFDFCSERNLNAESLYGQLAYFAWELYEKYSVENGYAYPVYETLTTSNSVSECLYTFFCHDIAGTNVELSYSNIYAGHTSTQTLYDRRAVTANSYFEKMEMPYSDF